jgi:hypothetical protein
VHMIKGREHDLSESAADDMKSFAKDLPPPPPPSCLRERRTWETSPLLTRAVLHVTSSPSYWPGYTVDCYKHKNEPIEIICAPLKNVLDSEMKIQS